MTKDEFDIGSKGTKDPDDSRNISRRNALMVAQIESATAKDTLSRLGFNVKVKEKGGKGTLDVTVPSFRGDVYREVDLIEEVARIHGYNNIPTDTRLSIQVSAPSVYERVEEMTRQLLVGWGLTEVITYSIVDGSRHQRAGSFSRGGGEALAIRNPMRKEEDRLRQTLTANHLRVKKHNQDRGVPYIKTFEISRVYLPKGNQEKLPEEKTVLCMLWEEEGASSEKAFYSLKGMVEAMFSALGARGVLRWHGSPGEPFEPKRSCRLELDGRELGALGEIKNEVVEEFDLNSHPVMAELDFDAIVEGADLSTDFKKPPLYPSAVRDMAVVVDERVGWADIEKCIKGSGLQHLERVEFFDLYRGKQLPAGKKSLAFKLCYRAPDRTLRGEEVNEMQKLVEDKLGSELGATLRK